MMYSQSEIPYRGYKSDGRFESAWFKLEKGQKYYMMGKMIYNYNGRKNDHYRVGVEIEQPSLENYTQWVNEEI